jgi:hypothetical protein
MDLARRKMEEALLVSLWSQLIWNDFSWNQPLVDGTHLCSFLLD